MWLVPHETAAISAHILCTPYNNAPVYLKCACVRFQQVNKEYMCTPVLLAEGAWQHATVDRYMKTAGMFSS